MAPPKFKDLSKKVSDLFKDDFERAGQAKLVVKSKANNGVNITVEGDKNNDTNQVSAFLESKYSHSCGINLKEKWTTKNVVTTEVSVKDKVMKGSTLTGEATFSPSTGPQGGKLKFDFASNKFTSNTSFDGTTFTTAGVFAQNNYNLGAQTEFDTAKASLKGYKIGMSYVQSDLVFTTAVSNSNDVQSSIFHVPNDKCTTGIQFSWNRATSNTTFALAGAYTYDAETNVKCKIDKDLNLGLAYVQQVRPGISLTMAASINTAQLNSDSHQLGFGLTFGDN